MNMIDNKVLSRLEQMLINWHLWCDRWRPKLDVPPTTIFARLQKTTELYDEEEIEHMINESICEQIDTEIQNLNVHQQAAIPLVTKNKVLGISVWRNPRYTKDELQKNYKEGMVLLAEALIRRGILQKC